jgi:hypothetical protein
VARDDHGHNRRPEVAKAVATNLLKKEFSARRESRILVMKECHALRRTRGDLEAGEALMIIQHPMTRQNARSDVRRLGVLR